MESTGKRPLLRCSCGYVSRSGSDISKARIIDFLLDAWNTHVRDTGRR